jgi:hypothetical protein
VIKAYTAEPIESDIQASLKTTEISHETIGTRDIYDRISTIFRQIFKKQIFIAVNKISQFQNGKR